MSGNILAAKGLVKKFRKKEALAGLDLELTPGATTVLLGPNGAGKTTLMRLALGTMKPTRGEIRVFGMDPLKRPREVRQAIGFVPSVPDAYGWMTLHDFFRLLRPQYPTWNDAYSAEVISALSIPERTPFKAMSLGQSMKAMLAAALAPEPRLLLLDEPFSSLDPLSREEVLRGILGQIRAEGRTVLCATHDLTIAARMADRVAVLSHGRIRAEGSLEEVLGSEEPTRVPDRILDLLRETAAELQEVC